MEYLTRKKLERRYGLTWMEAERILREHTRETLYRHPLPVTLWFAALASCFVLPGLLPSGQAGILARFAGFVLMTASLVATRLVKCDAILAAAQAAAKRPADRPADRMQR